MYPETRLRRLRGSAHIRAMVTEFTLSPANFILPLFVKEGLEDGTKNPVVSMPGVYQHSLSTLIEECREAAALGIPAVILFGIPETKDALGTGAYDHDGIVPRAIRAIKEAMGDEILVAADICLCEYTDHGHCAPVMGAMVMNDPGIELYAKCALEYARSGADIVAPSDMMDGRVGAIRQVLDESGHEDVIILSYAVKYASAFYGPFRDAAESGGFIAGPSNRRSHQMDPANLTQAFREVDLDIQEGADIIMVKPALPYLDVLSQLHQTFDVPFAAYQVSGEYAMIKAAASNGWVDEEQIMMESLLAIRRAGSTMTITYFAKDAARVLRR